MFFGPPVTLFGGLYSYRSLLSVSRDGVGERAVTPPSLPRAHGHAPTRRCDRSATTLAVLVHGCRRRACSVLHPTM
jgi:hypothetical protein